jgi:NAD(P)-dependent dehydrogenase (short-subunit alcohol dehydrogenase family)
VQAVVTQQNVVGYAASKGAVAAMTRAMALDLAEDNIRVNVVLPGSIDTPMLRASARAIDPGDSDRVIAEWGAVHPIGRVGWPAEVAAACVFLAGPGAAFITGSELRVDGGLTAGVAIAPPREE